MIEVVYCMRRRNGMSHDAFASHWSQIHVPIVMQNIGVLRLSRYERILPLQHAFSGRVERRRTMQEPYDGIAHLQWVSEEDMRHASESDEALAMQRSLADDEALFVDAAGSCRWVAGVIRQV